MVNYYAEKYIYLYYKESILFQELRDVLDDLVDSFFSEVLLNSASVPVIITDTTKTAIVESGNIDPEKATDTVFLRKGFIQYGFRKRSY